MRLSALRLLLFKEAKTGLAWIWRELGVAQLGCIGIARTRKLALSLLPARGEKEERASAPVRVPPLGARQGQCFAGGEAVFRRRRIIARRQAKLSRPADP
jgi:hypothetical protein